MKKKQVIALIAAIAVIGCAGGGYYFRNDILEFFAGSASAEDKVYVEKLSRVMNQVAGTENRYNGIVEAQDSYKVNADTSRSIKEILVEVGDTVEEGQQLAIYDTSEIDMQIKQAQLDLEGLNNELDSLKKELDTLNQKQTQLTEEDDRFELEIDINTAQNDITQKELDIESKKLEIEKYQTEVGDSALVSKQSGIVQSINENADSEYDESDAFMLIQQEGDYRVKGTISEQNVWMIAEGEPVIIRSRIDEQTWSGTLQKVDTDNVETNEEDYYYSASDSANSSTKYPFYVKLDNSEGLMLGQHVYIEMDEGQEEQKEGLWIFADYVVQEESGAYIWTANEKNRLEKRYVELGEFDNDLNQYEILSGITADDYIAWPMSGLYEGVTTVTDSDEVDYSSPLYNQEGTEMMDTEYYPMEDELYIPEDAEFLDDEEYEDVEYFYDTEYSYDEEDSEMEVAE